MLEKIDNDSREKINKAIEIAASAVESIVIDGVDFAMNKYN